MHIEVDQSGKIGDTGVATVLAFSDTESYAILIPAKVKRACIHELRRKGKSGTTLYVQLFAVGLFLLLKEAIERVSLVTIDLEYPGHDAAVKEHLLNLLRRAGVSVDANVIEFQQIHRGGGNQPPMTKHTLSFAVSLSRIRSSLPRNYWSSSNKNDRGLPHGRTAWFSPRSGYREVPRSPDQLSYTTKETICQIALSPDRRS